MSKPATTKNGKPAVSDQDVTQVYNLEAEMSALGSAFIREAAADTVFSSLAESDFYHPAHQMIYRAMRNQWERAEAIDIVTLKNELVRIKMLQEVGGDDFLIQVAEAVPSAANSAHYCEIVRERKIQRDTFELFHCGKKIMADEDLPVPDRVAKVQDLAMNIGKGGIQRGGFVPMKRVMMTLDAELDAILEGKQSLATSTGFYDLDELLGGGLFPGQLVIVGARPSMGKTALGLAMLVKMARAGHEGALVSLEMTEREIATRMASIVSRVPIKAMRTRMPADIDKRVRDAEEYLYDLPIHVDETSGLTVLDIMSRLRALKRANPGLRYVIIDYLQIIRGTGKYENRNVEVAAISGSLKDMAKQIGITVIALSQLSRALEARPNQRPIMADLRESGAIENDADIVLFVFRPNKVLCDRKHSDADWDPDRHETAELIVAKNRDGELGTAEVVFTPKFARFENMAKERLPI